MLLRPHCLILCFCYYCFYVSLIEEAARVLTIRSLIFLYKMCFIPFLKLLFIFALPLMVGMNYILVTQRQCLLKARHKLPGVRFTTLLLNFQLLVYLSYRVLLQSCQNHKFTRIIYANDICVDMFAWSVHKCGGLSKLKC